MGFQMQERMILVDRKDKKIGEDLKLNVHKNAQLHRAFSILIFNSKGRILLQKRANAKYHSGGKWSNACCGHPRPGETTLKAATRRLKEEFGFSSKLKEKFSFIYKARLDKGLTENEFLHVFIGKFDGKPRPNASEIEDWKFIGIDVLKRDISRHPGKYSYWFKIALRKYLAKI